MISDRQIWVLAGDSKNNQSYDCKHLIKIGESIVVGRDFQLTSPFGTTFPEPCQIEYRGNNEIWVEDLDTELSGFGTYRLVQSKEDFRIGLKKEQLPLPFILGKNSFFLSIDENGYLLETNHIENEEENELQFRINDFPVTIGKNASNDVSIPNDEFLSKEHAVLDYKGNKWYIKDLNSSNGVFIKLDLTRTTEITTKDVLMLAPSTFLHFSSA